MCGYCVAMTAKERETFYQNVRKGTVTTIPQHVLGSQAPRKGLRQRQAEELEMGAYEEAPTFRQALLSLCLRSEAMAETDNQFELKLIELTKAHGYEVLTTEDVNDEIRAAALRAGKPVPELYDHGHDHETPDYSARMRDLVHG